MRKKKWAATGWHQEKERILEIERESTRSQCVEKSLWRRQRTCRKTDYRMNEWMNRARNKISKSLSQGWRNYGSRAHNRKRNSILSHFFISFAQPASLYCEEYVHIGLHISDCAQSVHESPLLRNNTASETFLHKSGAVRSDDWIFIAGVLAWRWLGEYVTSDKTFYNLPLTQEVVAAPVTSTCSSLSHSSRGPF